jgi:hypothetical protein
VRAAGKGVCPMARTMLDSYFHGDKRVNHLAALCRESHLMTKGRLTQIYDHANSRWTDQLSAKEINIQAEWVGEGAFADLMCEADLAEKLEKGYYRIKGIKKRLDQLEAHIQKSKNGGNNRMKNARRDKRGRLLPNSSDDGPQNEPEPGEGTSAPPAGVQPVAGDSPAASSDLSLSLDLSLDPEDLSEGERAQSAAPPERNRKRQAKPPPPPHDEQSVKRFVTAYVGAYRERHGPEKRPACLYDRETRRQIVRFLEDCPFERAVALVAHYCRMDTDFFARKGHDFETFIRNLGAVGAALDKSGAQAAPASSPIWTDSRPPPTTEELREAERRIGFKPGEMKYGTKEVSRSG